MIYRIEYGISHARADSETENVDFEDEDTFVTKVNTVKESYFSKEIPEQIEESVSEEADDEVEVSSIMENYITALRKSSK